MNLVQGKLFSSAECDAVLPELASMLQATLQGPPLDVALLIEACDTLVTQMDSLAVMQRLPELGISPAYAAQYQAEIKDMLSADALRTRLRLELGAPYEAPRTLTYSQSGARATQRIAPLGVLFHITAGNVDGLPFLSLLDGLLTGNINLIKLPQEEGGLTVALLQELLTLAPALRDYVYVFDYSSRDAEVMQQLAQLADAVVVWGGDEAIRAVRSMATPNTRIIEWGHKISFAYVTKAGMQEAALEKLALHICQSNQLFCSSCQGIFLDTEAAEDVDDFCAKFLPILEAASRRQPTTLDPVEKLFAQAAITLEEYQRRIEGRDADRRPFRADNCSITACNDSRLEPSLMHRNPWVKPLRRDELWTLRPYKNYLQTAALLSAPEEHAALAQRLIGVGLVKISDGADMSSYAFGEAHDGAFTLRAYTRIVSVQEPPPRAESATGMDYFGEIW